VPTKTLVMTEAVAAEDLKRTNTDALAVSSTVEVPWWMKIDGRPVHDVEDVMDHFCRNKNQTGLESTATRAQQKHLREDQQLMQVLPSSGIDPAAANKFQNQLSQWKNHVDDFLRHRQTMVARSKRQAELGTLKSRNRLEVDDDEDKDSMPDSEDDPGSPTSRRAFTDPSEPTSPLSPTSPSSASHKGAAGQVFKSSLLTRKAAMKLKGKTKSTTFADEEEARPRNAQKKQSVLGSHKPEDEEPQTPRAKASPKRGLASVGNSVLLSRRTGLGKT